MGFLRFKDVKGHKYFYWSKRVRSQKKNGGSGKVRSIDLLLGDCPFSGKYLDYHFYMGSFGLEEYADAVIAVLWSEFWSKALENITRAGLDLAKIGKGIKCSTNWTRKAKPKIALRSSTKGLDCRLRYWRRCRRRLQFQLDFICIASTAVQETINTAAYELARCNFHNRSMKKQREIARDIRKNPSKEWYKWKDGHQVKTRWADGADLGFDEGASNSERRAAKWLEDYYKTIERLVDCSPPKQRRDFKQLVLSKTEDLSCNMHWVAKLEREWRIDDGISTREYDFEVVSVPDQDEADVV